MLSKEIIIEYNGQELNKDMLEKITSNFYQVRDCEMWVSLYHGRIFSLESLKDTQEILKKLFNKSDIKLEKTSIDVFNLL